MYATQNIRVLKWIISSIPIYSFNYSVQQDSLRIGTNNSLFVYFLGIINGNENLHTNYFDKLFKSTLSENSTIIPLLKCCKI